MIAILLCVLLLVAGSTSDSAQEAGRPGEPIRVFVGPNVREGLIDVDQGILDSIADIKKELRTFKGIVLVKKSEEATVTLAVIGRRVSGNAGGVAIPAGTATILAPIDRHAIETVLRFGSHEKSTISEDNGHGTWQAAAKQAAKDVVAWLNANLDVIERPTGVHDRRN